MKKIIFFVILFFLFSPFLVGAENGGLVPCSGPDCELCDLFQLFANLVEFVLIVIIPPVATLVFLYGGIVFYTAMGDSSKVNKGRQILISAVVGIAIIYSAHFLVSMLLSALGVGDVQWPNISIC